MKNISDIVCKKARKFSHSKKTFYSLIIFIIFIIVAEIVLRMTHLFGASISCLRPDPVLGWRYAPRSRYCFCDENDHPICGKINSYGWRDKEWLLQKPDDTYRIAVIGDSYVASHQVEEECTFLELVEQKLNSKGNNKVELMNFGCAAYAPTQELIVLEKCVEQFSVNMVLLFFCPLSDIYEVNKETSPNLLRPFCNVSEDDKLTFDTSFAKTTEYKIECAITWPKRHSAFLSVIYKKYRKFQMHKRGNAIGVFSAWSSDILTGKIKGSLSLCTDNPDERFVKNYQLNKMLITAMVKYCKERAIRFILVIPDIPTYLPEIENRCKLIDSTFNTYFFEDDMKCFAESIDVECLGLQRLCRKFFVDNGVELHWGGVGHWNYEGHKLIADILVKKLSIITPSNGNGVVK